MRKLLADGVDPNGQDYDQRCSLHIAAREGNVLMMVTLLKAGGRINSVDRWGVSPLEVAVVAGHTMVAGYLFSQGGRLSDGRSAKLLADATWSGHVERVNLMLDCGCGVEARDYDGRTALHRAAERNAFVIAAQLLHWRAARAARGGALATAARGPRRGRRPIPAGARW